MRWRLEALSLCRACSPHPILPLKGKNRIRQFWGKDVLQIWKKMPFDFGSVLSFTSNSPSFPVIVSTLLAEFWLS